MKKGTRVSSMGLGILMACLVSQGCSSPQSPRESSAAPPVGDAGSRAARDAAPPLVLTEGGQPSSDSGIPSVPDSGAAGNDDAAAAPDASASGSSLPALPAGTGSGTTYYVSPMGSDSNSGTSAASPWQTLAKVTSTTFMAGDSVLLQGGATFTGCLSFSGSTVQSTSAAPFTLGSYGTGRFTLQANCSGSRAPAVSIAGINGFLLRDAILVGNQGGAQYGVLLSNPTSSVVAGIRIQNCDISGFYTTNTQDYGAEIFIAGYPGGGMDHVSILNNALHGSAGPSSPDENGVTGWGGTPLTNGLFQGNTIYDLGAKANGISGTEGNGILAAGWDGCVVQYNVAHDLAGSVNTCGGGAGLWAYSSNNVTIQYNEVYNVRPLSAGQQGCDWDGFDLDGDVTNSVVQYNYAHDNYGGGIITCATCGSNTWGPNTIRYNVTQNNDTWGSNYYGEIVASNHASGVYELNIYNNTVYNDNGSSLLNFNQGTFASGVIANNLFIVGAPPNGTANVFEDNGEPPTWATIASNDWFIEPGAMPVWSANGQKYTSFGAYQSGTGWEVGSISADPSAPEAGQGGTCSTGAAPACPSAYEVASMSPVLGTGLNLANPPYSLTVGTVNYFGNPIPSSQGTGFNIGAD